MMVLVVINIFCMDQSDKEALLDANKSKQNSFFWISVVYYIIFGKIAYRPNPQLFF